MQAGGCRGEAAEANENRGGQKSVVSWLVQSSRKAGSPKLTRRKGSTLCDIIIYFFFVNTFIAVVVVSPLGWCAGRFFFFLLSHVFQSRLHNYLPSIRKLSFLVLDPGSGCWGPRSKLGWASLSSRVQLGVNSEINRNESVYRKKYPKKQQINKFRIELKESKVKDKDIERNLRIQFLVHKSKKESKIRFYF